MDILLLESDQAIWQSWGYESKSYSNFRTIPEQIKSNPIYAKIWETPRRGGNYIIIINGLPRSGKSWLANTIAYNLSWKSDGTNNFSPLQNLCYEKLTLLKKIKESNEVGKVIIWDEAGIAELGANAREFWSESNRGLSTLFQTMGFKRQIIIVTLPNRIMLDKHIRSLCHAIIDVTSFNKPKRKIFAKFHHLSMNRILGKDIEKNFRYVDEKGVHIIKSLEVPAPPRHVAREYVAMDKCFKDWLQMRLIDSEETRTMFEKGTRSSIAGSLGELYNKIKSKPEVYWNYKKARPSWETIVMVDDIPAVKARLIANAWAAEVQTGKSNV
jgi:hypothetical protein